MPVPPALRPTLALLLLPVLGGASSGDPAALPSGDASRQRMTEWQAPAGPPALSTFVLEEPQAKRTAPKGLIRLSSGFGTRIDPIDGSHRVHTGLDMPGRAGTPILAAAVGTISFAGRAGGYGQMVEIDHGNGLKTRYAHLSQILVRPGDTVSLQQTIALMGSTGRSTGNHLHFEVRVNGRATDPRGWFGSSAAPPAAATSAPVVPAATHISDFARRRAAAAAE